MLTVKICRPCGSESVFEATDVDKEKGGLLIQRDGTTEFYGPGGQRYAIDWDGRLEPRGGAMEQTLASVFVMNRHGATVATYKL